MIMAGLLVLVVHLFLYLCPKWMALRSVGGQVIENPTSEVERWLLDTVRRQSEQVGIKMPQVAIYDAPDINAFATGARRDASLVAVVPDY